MKKKRISGLWLLILFGVILSSRVAQAKTKTDNWVLRYVQEAPSSETIRTYEKLVVANTSSIKVVADSVTSGSVCNVRIDSTNYGQIHSSGCSIQIPKIKKGYAYGVEISLTSYGNQNMYMSGRLIY